MAGSEGPDTWFAGADADDSGALDLRELYQYVRAAESWRWSDVVPTRDMYSCAECVGSQVAEQLSPQEADSVLECMYG